MKRINLFVFVAVKEKIMPIRPLILIKLSF
jgi:hypothetical protein